VPRIFVGQANGCAQFHTLKCIGVADIKVECFRAGFNWWEAWGEIKIEGFGGRPPFGGRPNAK